jgi:hypothetical protein
LKDARAHPFLNTSWACNYTIHPVTVIWSLFNIASCHVCRLLTLFVIIVVVVVVVVAVAVAVTVVADIAFDSTFIVVLVEAVTVSSNILNASPADIHRNGSNARFYPPLDYW